MGFQTYRVVLVYSYKHVQETNENYFIKIKRKIAILIAILTINIENTKIDFTQN